MRRRWWWWWRWLWKWNFVTPQQLGKPKALASNPQRLQPRGPPCSPGALDRGGDAHVAQVCDWVRDEPELHSTVAATGGGSGGGEWRGGGGELKLRNFAATVSSFQRAERAPSCRTKTKRLVALQCAHWR
eukprot:SAG11_NODE_1074_length_5968_cov_2.041063_7_plen_130_part_00